MYHRDKNFIRGFGYESSSFIEGRDYQNSEFLRLLDMCPMKEYVVSRFEHRMDLISDELYGSKDYEWIIRYINRVSSKDILRGRVLKYPTKETLVKIKAEM